MPLFLYLAFVSFVRQYDTHIFCWVLTAKWMGFDWLGQDEMLLPTTLKQVYTLSVADVIFKGKAEYVNK